MEGEEKLFELNWTIFNNILKRLIFDLTKKGREREREKNFNLHLLIATYREIERMKLSKNRGRGKEHGSLRFGRDRGARRHYHGGQRECKRALVAITPWQNVVPSTGKLHSTVRARYEPVSRAITFRLLPPSWNDTPFARLATIADCEWDGVTQSRRLAAIEKV